MIAKVSSKPAKKPAEKSRKRPRRRQGGSSAEIPRKDTIVGSDTLTMPGGARFTILKTDQVDPYDPPPRRSPRR